MRPIEVEPPAIAIDEDAEVSRARGVARGVLGPGEVVVEARGVGVATAKVDEEPE